MSPQDPRIADLVTSLELPEEASPELAADILAALVGSIARHLTPEVEATLAARGVPFEVAVMHLAQKGLQGVIDAGKVGAL